MKNEVGKLGSWSWTVDKAGKRYLTSNFMIKSLQFFNVGGPALQARSQHFIEVWPEFAPPKQMASLTPKSTIARKLPVKARWWDAPLTFRDFSRSNKHDCSWLVAVKIELIVSGKTGSWTIVCTRLLIIKFPLAAMFIDIYNVLMLFERFSREEAATKQLPCASVINI